MINELISAFQITKTTIVLLKDFKTLSSDAERNSAVIEIQDKVLETQQLIGDMQSMAKGMQARIDELEAVDKSKFELVEIENQGYRYSGRSAYRLKDTGMYYCPVCFGKSQLTPLQYNRGGSHICICGGCSNRLGSADESADHNHHQYSQVNETELDSYFRPHLISCRD